MKCFLEHVFYGFNVGCAQEWSIEVVSGTPVFLGRSEATHISDLRMAALQGLSIIYDILIPI